MRKIHSPVEKWPGYIGLPKPLTYPQLVRIQDMLDEIGELVEKHGQNAGPRINNACLPFLFELVEEWAIEGIEQDPGKFPAEPLKEANQFIDWWFGEVITVLRREEPKNA